MRKVFGLAILASFLSVFACQKLDELNVPDFGNDTSGLYSGDSTQCRIVETEAVSPYEIRLYFDNGQFISDLTNIDLYQVAQGSMIVQSALANGDYISLQVSNQIPFQNVSLTVPQYDFQRFSGFNISTNGTTVTTNSNYTTFTLRSGNYSIQTYGSLDSKNPTLNIMFPPNGYVFNLAVTGNKILVKTWADDDYSFLKLEYRVDSQDYQYLGDSSYLDGQIPALYYNEGVHTLFIRVTDGAGHSVVQSRSIVLGYDVPEINIDYPQNNMKFHPGNSIPVQASCADVTVIQGYIRIHNSISNTPWLAMTGGPTNWSYNYHPSLQEAGSTTFEFRTVNAGNQTNSYSNTLLLYDDRAIYVSDTGLDQPGRGHINAPLRNYNMARSIATSVGITNVYFTSGSFADASIQNGINIRGGYSEDFSTHDPAQYHSVFHYINGVQLYRMSLKDFYATAITVSTSFKLSLSNIIIQGDIYNNGLNLNWATSNRISDCVISNSLRGFALQMLKDCVVENCTVTSCGRNFVVSGIGGYLNGNISGNTGTILSNVKIINNNVTTSAANVSDYGGGLYIYNMDVNIIDSVISNNRIILNSTYYNNYASTVCQNARGGGIYFDHGHLNLQNTLIKNNQVYSHYNYTEPHEECDYWGDCRHWYSYWSGWSAYGGGIYLQTSADSYINFNNTTVTDNNPQNVYPPNIYP